MCTVTNRKGLLALGVVLFLLPILGAGCSPKIVERIVVQHDTTTVHHRDTTYHRDSIYIREWMKGDTVYVDRFRDRYIFRDRWRDSVSVREVHDTTAVEVKVEKNLSWSQKAKIGAFPWLLLALIGAALWIFRKYLF
jgi:hypothetical protein